VSYKLVLVGEAPGRDDITERPSLALTGSTGKNLCAIAGWDWLNYLRYTERRNLFYTPQFAWSRWAAEGAAEEMIPLFRGRRVILLGVKVAEAFHSKAINAAPNYEWLDLYDGVVAKVPHPSGRNRMWNSKDERAAAHEFLKDLLDA
jgi:uracil-DNA glycosylase